MSSLDLHDYERKIPASTFVSDLDDLAEPSRSETETAPPLDMARLLSWLSDHIVCEGFKAAQTVVLIVDTQPLAEYAYFTATTGSLWHQRSRMMQRERLHVAFVPCLEENSLRTCHMTHAFVHVARALRVRFPGKHIIASDADCAPCALMEVWQQVELGRFLEELRLNQKLPAEHTPGLILHNEKDVARANAGLVVFPGVGHSSCEVVVETMAWVSLCSSRVRHLLQSAKDSQVSTAPYNAHLASWAHGTPLSGVVVEEPQDYLHLAAVILEVLNSSAWVPNATRRDRASLAMFSDSIRKALPRLNGWAGPFFEQPVLAFLEAFQSSTCYITYLPSELGFMVKEVSSCMGTADMCHEVATMPPIYVHGYGAAAKRALCKLQLDYWVTFEQALHGSLKWKPHFMAGGSGHTSRVQVSAGFRASVKVHERDRSFVPTTAWQEVLPSVNKAFLDQLLPQVVAQATFPLWHRLFDATPEPTTVEQGHADNASQCARKVCIECPGLCLSSGITSTGDLYDIAPDLTFQNTGVNAVYGPTREPASYNRDCRIADRTMNALHYILRDDPCIQSFRRLFSDLEMGAFPSFDTGHTVPFCDSWHAPPCSSVVLALLAFVSQFTWCADSWLFMFSNNTETQSGNDEHRVVSTLPCVGLEIRGFSAGSYTGVLLFRLLQEFQTHLGVSVCCTVGGLALPSSQFPHQCSSLRVIHVIEDTLCRWRPSPETLAAMRAHCVDLTLITCEGMYWDKEVVGRGFHGYSFLVRGHETLQSSSELVHLQNALAEVVMPAVGDHAKYFWLFLAWFTLRGGMCQSLQQILDSDLDSTVPRSLRETFAKFASSTSTHHIKFITSLVFPWAASGVRTNDYRHTNLSEEVSSSEIVAHLEILAKLSYDTVVVKLWFHGDRNMQQGWAAWDDADPGFFNGEQLHGFLKSADASHRFSGVIVQVRWTKSFSTVREMEMLMQVESSSDDAILELVSHGPTFELQQLWKKTSRIKADTRLRLLTLHPSLLRMVWGRNDLGVIPAVDAELHPSTHGILNVALSWELASRRLQSTYPEVLQDMSSGRYDTLWSLVRGADPQDALLHAMWQPLDKLGKTFGVLFWTILAQPSSALPRFLAHIGISFWRRVKAAHIQGVPGSGKTTIMAIVSICLCVQFDLCILWTAVNTNAVQEGAERLSSLLADAVPAVQDKFVRFLGLRHAKTCAIDVPLLARRSAIGQSLNYKVILMTEGGFCQEHGFSYTKLCPAVDISLKDEAQQAGTPDHAFQLSFLKNSGICVNVGDPKQTKLAVDARNEDMRRLVEDINDRDPGIRCSGLRFLAIPKWDEEVCAFFGLEAGNNAIVSVLEHMLQSVSPLPSDVDEQAVRSGAHPQISLGATLRNPSFSYSLYIAAEYDNLVHWSCPSSSSGGELQLGVMPPPFHDSGRHVDKKMQEVVWIQPWGKDVQTGMQGHMRNVLGILSYMIFHHGVRYTSEYPLGVVMSHRRLFELLRTHFDQEASLQFAGAKIVRNQKQVVENLGANLLETLQHVLEKDNTSQLSIEDVCQVVDKAPWLVKHCIRLNVAMSAVGCQRLDVLMYRIPGRFVDRNDQTVVAASRHLGHLYIYCDINRVKQMLCRLGALVFRTCPVLYANLSSSCSVSECASSLAPPQPVSTILDRTHTASLLSKASNSWTAMPFAVGVHVVTDSGDTYTRLLLGRPCTPAYAFWCRCPREFWLDAYSNWMWEVSGRVGSDRNAMDDLAWFVKPRFPNWIFQIGRSVVALQSDRVVREHRTFAMKVVAHAVSQPGRSHRSSVAKPHVAAVYVSAMPSHIFPTYLRWNAEDVRLLMSIPALCPADSALEKDVEHAEQSLQSENHTIDVSVEEDEYDEDIAEGSALQDEDVLVYNEYAVEMHNRAQHSLDRMCQSGITGLSDEVAMLLKVGYSVDAPWCILTFHVEQLIECISKAKLARLATKLVEEFGVPETSSCLASLKDVTLDSVPQSLLKDEFLFDILAGIFNSLFSLLDDGAEPAWWKDVLPDTAFSVYWSKPFLKFQLLVALRNMGKPDELHAPCMFFFTQQTIGMGGQRMRVPDRVRMQMPKGLALFFQHTLTRRTGTAFDCNGLSFQVEPIGQGASIGLVLDEELCKERLSVFRDSRLFHEFVRHGVNEKLLISVGGKIHPVRMKLQSVCEVVTPEKSKTVNCNILRSYFLSYAASDIEAVAEEGAQKLGATYAKLKMYIDVLTAPLSFDLTYRRLQLAVLETEAYLRDGMPFKKLTDDAKTYPGFLKSFFVDV